MEVCNAEIEDSNGEIFSSSCFIFEFKSVHSFLSSEFSDLNVILLSLNKFNWSSSFMILSCCSNILTLSSVEDFK